MAIDISGLRKGQIVFPDMDTAKMPPPHTDSEGGTQWTIVRKFFTSSANPARNTPAVIHYEWTVREDGNPAGHIGWSDSRAAARQAVEACLVECVRRSFAGAEVLLAGSFFVVGDTVSKPEVEE